MNSKQSEPAGNDGLPNYLNHHGDAAERARMAALLADDPALAAEADLMHTLRAAVREEAAAIDACAGLGALRQRMAKPSPWRHLRTLLDLVSGPVAGPAISAALVLICVVQGAMLWQAGRAAPATIAIEQPAGTLAWRGAPGPAAAKASLQVRFDDQARLADIEAALAMAQARIVSGPMADRSYLLDASVPVAAQRILRLNPVVREVRALPGQPGAR